MANTILTSTVITREALRILHQKLNFVGNINRSYDDRFAQEGAKIGTTLNIRLPNQYTVSSGPALAAQDTSEANTSLTVSSQKHVDVNFTSAELTMSLDDFSERILSPAMAVLAANIEADALNMYKDVYQVVGTPGTVPNAAITYLQSKARLTNSLAPQDRRSMVIDPTSTITIVDALKGLFNAAPEVSKQYREGAMGRALGYDWFENTMMPTHTNGSMGGTPLVNGATQTGSTIAIDGVTAGNTWTQGTIFTMAGVFEVHPETKAVTNRLQAFVVTADATFTGGAANVSVSPALVTSGARQNVSASAADNAAITILSGSASTGYQQSLAFHKDAFTFATADLIMPQGVDFARREVMDGISLRIVRQYDINNDKLPCRMDVLYGYKTIRPQLAARITS